MRTFFNWQGPSGSTIDLTFNNFDVEDDIPICEYDYVEVKTHGPTKAGPR